MPTYLTGYPVYPLARVDDVVASIKRGFESLSNDDRAVLAAIYSEFGTPMDQLLANPVAIDGLAEEFHTRSGKMVAGRDSFENCSLCESAVACLGFVVDLRLSTRPPPLGQLSMKRHHSAMIQLPLFSARNKPSALCQVSSYSRSGTDWATMPPPTGNCHQPRPAVIVRIRMFRSAWPSKPR